MPDGVRPGQPLEWRFPRTVPVERHRVGVESGKAWVEVLIGGNPARGIVAAAHPLASLGAEPLALLASVTGARVYVLNGRGVGGSQPIDAAETDLERVVADLEEARVVLGSPRWLWWGMSAGGYVGQLYAHRHPDAFAGLILDSTAPCFRAAVLDPDSVLSPYNAHSRPAIESAGLLGPIDDELIEDARLAWINVKGAAGPLLRVIGGPAVLVSPIPPTPAMKRGIAALWRFDSRAWLKSLTMPTLVLAGPNDPILPVAHARALRAAIPNAEYLEPPGAGHTPVNERPDEIAAALAPFLARVFG